MKIDIKPDIFNNWFYNAKRENNLKDRDKK